MKKKYISMLSGVTAFAMLALSSVSAFAADNTEFIKKRNDLNYRLNCYNSTFVQPELYATNFTFPRCSFEESKEMGNVVSEIKGKLWSYTTVDEIENANQTLDEAVKKMYVADFELEWLLNYMKRDCEDNGYYNEEISAQIKTIYKGAEEALDSKDGESIHKAYIELRNLLSRLCQYNPHRGDTDGNGRFDVNDITIAQRYLAQMEKINSSQAFNLYVTRLFTVNNLTLWQRTLSEFNPMPTDEPYEVLAKYGELDTDCTDFTLSRNIDGKAYTPESRELNYMYYTDKYTFLH